MNVAKTKKSRKPEKESYIKKNKSFEASVQHTGDTIPSDKSITNAVAVKNDTKTYKRNNGVRIPWMGILGVVVFFVIMFKLGPSIGYHFGSGNIALFIILVIVLGIGKIFWNN